MRGFSLIRLVARTAASCAAASVAAPRARCTWTDAAPGCVASGFSAADASDSLGARLISTFVFGCSYGTVLRASDALAIETDGADVTGALGAGDERGSSLGGATLLVWVFGIAGGGTDAFPLGRGALPVVEARGSVTDAFAFGIEGDADVFAFGTEIDPELDVPFGGGGAVGRVRGGGRVGGVSRG